MVFFLFYTEAGVFEDLTDKEIVQVCRLLTPTI